MITSPQKLWLDIPNRIRGQYFKIESRQAVFDSLYEALNTYGPDNRVHQAIVGESGVGKSSLIAEFARSAGSTWRNEQEDKILNQPIVVAVLPRDASPKDTAAAIAKSLGIGAYQTKTETKLTDAIIEHIDTHRVRMLIVDEFQQAKANHSRPLHDVRQLFKVVDSCVPVCFTFVGMPGCENILKTEAQLSSRLSSVHRLKRFRMNDKGQLKEFVKFLSLVNDSISEIDGQLTESNRVIRIYAATRGNLRAMMKLLGFSFMYALHSGSRSLEDQHLEESFNKHLLATYDDDFKPFSSRLDRLSTLDWMQDAVILGI